MNRQRIGVLEAPLIGPGETRMAQWRLFAVMSLAHVQDALVDHVFGPVFLGL